VIDQRGRQHFADFGVGLNEGVHLVAGQLNNFARLAGGRASARGDRRRPNDLDSTGFHNEERHVGLAGLD
jgi:hypothetical protein